MTESGGTPRKLTRAQERELAATNAAAFAGLRARRLALLRELHDAGWTHAELGELYSCSKQRIQLLLRCR